MKPTRTPPLIPQARPAGVIVILGDTALRVAPCPAGLEGHLDTPA